MKWDVVGHQKITHYLENSIVNDNLTHAYLFCAPKLMGAKSLTKKFIANLMCYTDDPSKSEIPCGECEHCRQIEKNIHPDVYWLKRESDKKNITVEQIRQLQENLSVHSFFKSYKVAIIENAEDMNLAAFNALLKTLEEPTPKTIIILMVRQIRKIPKTVISRTQKIKFLPVPEHEIFDYLLTQGASREQARHLSNLANGRPERATLFYRNSEVHKAYLGQLDSFFWLINNDFSERFKFIEKLLKTKENLIQKVDLLMPILNLWQLIVRDLILFNLNQNDKIINSQAEQNLIQYKNKYNLSKLVELQKNIDQTKRYLQMNVNPRLVMENLLLNF